MQTRASSIAPLLFLFWTIVCQVVAWSTLILVWEVFPSSLVSLASASLMAGLVARVLALSLPWQVLNTILPIAIASTLWVEIPSYLYLALFLATFLIYLPAFWTRVPYYPTPKPAYGLVLAELPLHDPFHFLDIGSGFGEMVIFLARRRPHGSFVGIEIGIIPFVVSALRAKMAGVQNVRFIYKNMWSYNLQGFSHVYAFLSPAPMPRLWEKVSREMQPGTLFMSNTFETPAPPTSVIGIKDNRRSSLYLYRIP